MRNTLSSFYFVFVFAIVYPSRQINFFYSRNLSLYRYNASTRTSPYREFIAVFIYEKTGDLFYEKDLSIIGGSGGCRNRRSLHNRQ